MSTSYQEIDTRLRVMEDMLSFTMGVLRVRGQVPNGLLGPDGQPQATTKEGSLLDWYKESKLGGLDVQTQAEKELA